LDVACHACAYNLRGLSRDTVCPECARPVAESLKSRRLIDADANWLRTVRWGVRFILLSGAIGLVDTIIREGGTWPVRLAGGAVAAVGVVLLTRREPASAGGTAYDQTRWTARLAAFAVIPASTSYLTFDGNAYPRLFTSLIIAQVLAGCIMLVAVLIWSARLLRRAQRRFAARLSWFTLVASAASSSIALVYYACYLAYYNPLANQLIAFVEAGAGQAVRSALDWAAWLGVVITLILLWVAVSSSIRAAAVRATVPDASVRHRQVDVLAIPRRVMWWMIIGLPILIVLIERIVTMFRRQ
jgi:hypothetical protein